MDSGILILPFLMAAVTAAQVQSTNAPANPPVPVVSGSRISADSTEFVADAASSALDTAGADSLKPRRIVMRDRTPAWPIPARDGSAGGALREAFRKGDATVPWTRIFEFDGMWEDWRPWPSLPIEERAVRASWTGPSLAGASDAGPLAVVAVAKSIEPGFGGVPLRRELSAPSPVDTPLTQIQFWRGALASYQFGLDFERAVAGPWGIALRMETRSAQGKNWTYRDQIQDMFQGSFGRKREDLPASGRSPGLDDVQWESVVSRATPELLIEGGYTWVDLHRGIPNPLHTWQGNDTIPFPGRDARSGWFGRILGGSGLLTISVAGRAVTQNWSRAVWSDTGKPVSANGSTSHQEGEADISFGPDNFRLGIAGRGALRTGTSSRLEGEFQEDLERTGVYLAAAIDSLRFRCDAGWSRLNDPLDRTHIGLDGSIRVDWKSERSGASLRVARELEMPDWEISVLPDPLLQSLPSRTLVPEGRWIAQSRIETRILSWLGLDAGAAGMLIENSIQPYSINYGEAQRTEMRLTNQSGLGYGWSGQMGARADWRGYWVASQWAVGMTMLADGNRDPRFAAIHSRSTLGWEGSVLAGRASIASSMSLDIAGASRQVSGIDKIVYEVVDGSTQPVRKTASGLTRIPPTANLAWENRFQIKTFALFWRLQNILDMREMPAAGWTPPGIRSGWGITWNFGG
jgi:hypothetical protein